MNHRPSQVQLLEESDLPLASQATILENAQLRASEQAATQAAEQRARQMETLHQIGMELSTLKLDAMLAKIVESACTLTSTEMGTIYLLDQQAQDIVRAIEFPAAPTERQKPRKRGGLTALVLRSGDPVIIPDAQSDPRVRRMVKKEGVQALLGVPLKTSASRADGDTVRTIGVLFVDSRVPREFGNRDIDMLQSLASQAAIAIEKAQLIDELEQERDSSQRMASQLLALYEITKQMQLELDLPSLLDLISRLAVELLHADAAGILLLDEAGEHLVFKGSHGLGEQIVAGTRDVIGGSIAGRVVQTGEPIIANDIPNDWRFDNPAAGDEGLLAIVSTPLRVGGNIIGTLDAHSKTKRHAFSEDDLGILSLMANQAAVAIENARLFRHDHDKLERLEMLSQANSAMMGDLGTLPLYERLSLIAGHAARILGAETCGIFLVKQPGVLSLEASYGHRRGMFERGRTFEIASGPGTGLSGHIAYAGKLFNLHGEALINHPAVKQPTPGHAPSGRCCSLLAIPLKRRIGPDTELIGLLRVDNKKDQTGQPNPAVGFTTEDEKILKLFADAVVVAIEGAELVTQLREQKAQLGRLIASSPNGVIAIDLHGRVSAFNARAEAILGYAEQDVLGISVDRLYDDAQEPNRIGELLRHAPDGKLSHHETVVRSATGERIPIRLTATWLYDAHDNPIGSVGYFEDLRSIKETERRLAWLLQAGDIVAQAENLTDGLQSLAELLVKLLNTTFCQILLLDESQRFLMARAAFPSTPAADQLGWRPEISQHLDIAEWPELADSLSAGAAHVFELIEPRHQAFMRDQSRRLGLPSIIRSLLVIPLRTGNRLVGALALGDLRPDQRTPFSTDQQELAAAIADQTAVLIERLRRHEITMQREQRLTALDEAALQIRADTEPFRLIQEIVHSAVALVDGTAGGLFVNRPHLQELELRGVFELPLELIGTCQSHAIGLAGWVARTGQTKIVQAYASWPERETLLAPYGYATVIGVPIKQAGEVKAVLAIAYRNPTQPTEIDLDVLERFALRGFLALQTARLISQEQRMYRPLTLLHRMSEYIQTVGSLDKIVHAFLTCVTAGYGLAFNRAALFLLDESREFLEGYMGIGQLTNTDAQEDWEYHRQRGLEDFGRYLELMAQGELPITPIGRRIAGLRFPARSTHTELFWKVVYEPDYLFATPDIRHRLPASLVAAFEPALPFVVVPLNVGEQVIGFLIADNKFTGSPITSEDIEQLLTFAGTAALVIDNAWLLQGMRTEQEKLRSLYRTSDALISPQHPRQVLQYIVEQTWAAAKATSVSMLLIDEPGSVRDVITAGMKQEIDVRSVIRPNGISVQVLDSGRPAIIEDADRQLDRVNPTMLDSGFAAALCLPLSLPLQDKRAGVVWIHYSKARHFSRFEVEALQLYVNQAAIAYDNARRVKELEYMRQAIEALAKATRLTDIYQQIAHTAQVVLHAESTVIWAYDAVSDRFDLEEASAAGIPLETWEACRRKPPLRGGTAYTVMEQGWVGVEQLDGELPAFIGPATRELLERIGARSFQGAALRVGDECLGVLYANYSHPRQFSAQDQRDLKSLAAQAAVAIQNTRRFEDLKRIKSYIGSQTAVDWIRMVSTAWGHGIRREVGTALGRVALLRGLLEHGAQQRDLYAEIDQLDEVIRGIKEIPITAPLSYEDAVDSVEINKLVKTYLDRQWKLARYSPVRLRYNLQLNLDHRATVRASREWLRQAFEIVVDNAVQAMLDADSPTKQLIVTTRQAGAKVEIMFQDSGPGIPEHIREKLFKEPIDKPVGSRGAGIGLMLARTIIQAYTGDMYIETTDKPGTTVVIVFPIE